MPDPPTPTPPPARARPALLAGGLALVVAGLAVLAWVLASAAGLVGGADDPSMDETPRTLELQGGIPATSSASPPASRATRARVGVGVGFWRIEPAYPPVMLPSGRLRAAAEARGREDVR